MGLKRKYSNHLFIPVELCSFAVSEKLIRPFQLYIYLKSKCSGKLKLSDVTKQQIKKALNLRSERAIKNNLKILLKRNWIGYNKKTGYYFIRSFDKLKQLENLKRKTGAEFNTEKIKNFKAFLAGAVICSLVNQQKRKKWKLERENGRSKHGFHKCLSYYPVASKALSKCLKISISTAFELKKIAVAKRYVKVKKNFKPLLFEKNTPIGSEHKSLYKKSVPERSHLVRSIRFNLFEQDIDTFLPCIRLKRLRNHGKKSKH